HAEGCTLRILYDREAARIGNVLWTVYHLATERRRETRRLVDTVTLDVRHPVRRHALFTHVRTEPEESRERSTSVRPHGVVLVELLRSPPGDRRIEFSRSVGVGRRKLVPHELTVHCRVPSEGGGGKTSENARH